MFKKFSKEDLSGYTQVKASVARGIRCEQSLRGARLSCCCPASQPAPPALHCVRCSLLHRQQLALSSHNTCLPDPCHLCNPPSASIGEQYPFLADTGVLDVLIPKKDPIYVGKTYVATSLC
jgi:hypothetical protein